MIPLQFHSIADVDAWLNSERLACPYCEDGGHLTRRGQRHIEGFTNLGRHLATKHDMTAERFRAAFGIPHNRGLIGRKLHRRLVDRQRAQLARSVEHRKKFVGSKRRRRYSVHKMSATQLADMRERIQPMGVKARWSKTAKN